MHWRRPTADFFAQNPWRLPSDYPEPDVGVWDENVFAIEMYDLFSSQWRTGNGGLIGLDLNVFQRHMIHLGVSGDEYEDTLRKLAVIESAAITCLRRNS